MKTNVCQIVQLLLIFSSLFVSKIVSLLYLYIFEIRNLEGKFKSEVVHTLGLQWRYEKTN